MGDYFQEEAQEAAAFEAELEAGTIEETTGEPVDEAPQGEEAADPAPEGEGDQQEGEESEESGGEPDVEQETEQQADEPREESNEPKQPKKKKPPEGYVEIQALSETRKKMKEHRDKAESLEAENQALLMEVQRLMSGEAAPKKPEFKELTPEELADLKEEDPDEYNEYRFNLMEHNNKVREFEKAEAQKQAVEQMALRDVDAVSDDINEMLAEKETVKALIDYGTDSGFSQADLVALSQPQTKIVTGDGKTRYLGKAALTFLKHLDAGRKSGIESIRSDVEKELRPRIEKEVTEKILAKYKEPEAQQSLEGQGEKGVKRFPDDMSEEAFKKLSPADQEAWLLQ